MTLLVYIAQSLDGFIAGKHGELDWLNDLPNPENSDFGFNDFLDGIDAIVMGRNTFEIVKGFDGWPYTKPVFVISSTLTELPPEYAGKAKILDLQPREIIDQLHKEGFDDLYIDGGLLIQSFLIENLIDELIITSIPVLLGEGISLFGKLDNRIRFKLHKSEILNNSLVKNHYLKISQEQDLLP
ncbi:MAG: dihydrofolate reductase family protein [Anaerolineales bacterium]|nr:dihydrofolate reductase family protein [Anaerolineales bacterium]